MKKELVEEALTNIDDIYIEEAITYDKSKIINFPQNTSKLMKAATVTLAVLVAGSATIYAGATVARKVFITDHSMEMGTLDDSEEEELREDDTAEESTMRSCRESITRHILMKNIMMPQRMREWMRGSIQFLVS